MSKTDYHGNVAAQAWDETRNAADPPFAAIPEVAFRENLEFRAAKVKETGIALTNFEKKVAELLTSDEFKDSGPMAVVDNTTQASLESAAMGLVEKSAEEKAAVKKADDDKKAADAAALKNAAKAVTDSKPPTDKKAVKATDKSGHIPSAAEKTAAAKEAAKSPLK